MYKHEDCPLMQFLCMHFLYGNMILNFLYLTWCWQRHNSSKIKCLHLDDIDFSLICKAVHEEINTDFYVKEY